MKQPLQTALAMLATLAVTAAWGAPPEAPAPVSLTAVRAWPTPGASRIALELSREASYAHDRLTNPDRIFLDLRDTVLKLPGRAPHIVKVDDALVSRVRLAQKEARVVRVVLDLTQPNLEYKVSQLENPPRIIIELRTKSARPETVTPEVQPPDTVTKPVAEAESAPAPVAPAPVPAEPAPAPVAAGPGSGPQPARKLSNGGRDMTRVLGLKLGRVVIDPGHGGHDQGTAGPSGLLEKELVLDVSLRIGQLLKEMGVSDVVFTRDTDVYVGLEERPAIASRARADLFLSIHANSSPIRNISGAETYYLNFTSVKADLDVAARENASTQKSMFELRELLQKIALKDKLDESREFATRVQSSLAAFWAKSNEASFNRGVKKAPFVVLIGATMPSILAEIGFISNPKDEAMLKRDDYRQQLADAVARGVMKYAESLSKMESARK
jgi:N-acetylmuramoyl-L-alanine amidase